MTYLHRASLLALTLLVLTGCDAPKVEPVPTLPELVIYTDRGAQFLRPIVEGFEQAGKATINYHRGSAGELLARLASEGARTRCDLLLLNDPAALEQARAKGLLSPITDATLLSRIPAEYRAADASWIGVSARLRVLVYNTEKVKAGALTSVFDLAAAARKGKVGIVESDNGSFIGGIAALLTDHGPEKTTAFLAGLKVNSAGHVFPKHTPLVAAVAKGAVEVGYVNHYDYYHHKAKSPDAPIAIALPDQQGGKGCAWNVVGVGVTRTSTQPELVKAFLTHLLSAEGQAQFVSENHEYPVATGVAAHERLIPRDKIALSKAGVAAVAGARTQAVELIQAVGLD